jgi:hypothetical protein
VGRRQTLLLRLQLRLLLLLLLLELRQLLPTVWTAALVRAMLGRDRARYYIACARLGLREAAMSSLGSWSCNSGLTVGIAAGWQSAGTKTTSSGRS